jgi:TonB family protein
MNHDAIRTDWVGEVVGSKFRLLRWLGSAGRSQVFACQIEENPTQKAAIKLFPAGAKDAQACASGWATALTLLHPHLIRSLYTGQDRMGDTYVLYVVTECASEILSEILPERPLTPQETREMLGPTLDALAYLHGKGLVHGRIKPSNIMVVDDQLKLSEENIRGSAGAAPQPAALDIYDAPERAVGKILPASDLWSLGMVLVEALTQIPPVWSRTGAWEPKIPPSVPKPFDQIARECLRLDPSLRCTVAELKACLETGAALPHRSPGPVEGLPRFRRKTVIAASAGVLLVVFAILILRPHREAPAPVQVERQTEASAPASTQPSPAKKPSPPKQKAASKPAAPVPESQAPAQETVAAPQPSAVPAAEAPAPAPESQAPASAQAPPEPESAALPAPQSAPAPGKGAVLNQVLPNVPAKAAATIHGTIWVGIQVHVGASGSVEDASIEAQGPSAYFANLALEAARSWKFTPPQIDGQAAPSVWLLRFHFRRDGTDVTPTEQTP